MKSVVTMMGWGGVLGALFLTGCSGPVEATTEEPAAGAPDVFELFENTNRRLVSDSADGESAEKLLLDDRLDASGKVRVRVYECSAYGQVLEVRCGVDPDEVLVGGGAWADYGPPPLSWGALLVASAPLDANLETWVGKSKDHMAANHHTLHTYAVGMKLTGVTRATLLGTTSANAPKYIVYREMTSGSDPHPSVDAPLPGGYQVLGGGGLVNYSGCNGVMLTASYRSSGTKWFASAKDHESPCSGTISARVIGVTTGTIPGFGQLLTQQRSASIFSNSGVGTISKNQTSGWATVCAGGATDGNRLLFQMSPTDNDNFRTGSKDHITPAAGATFTYVMEVKKKP
ncbi:MAG: hypothetical protein EOO73_28245 [Myxococcales bacterium]|nr:MAG: hypothetical protein EOO73_28245 [Myxococcales bacterium]